jgi:hypothetical protein
LRDAAVSAVARLGRSQSATGLSICGGTPRTRTRRRRRCCCAPLPGTVMAGFEVH